MLSSISSSEPPAKWPEEYWRRPIPTAHWRAVGIMMILVVGAFIVAWEVYWRTEGYEPGFENTADLWSAQRAKVGRHGKQETVIIGSSRILFGLDLDMWQQASRGPRPIELAVVGTCPLPVLHDLAEDPLFAGTVLCGVTEALFFLPAPAPPAQEVAKFVKHYHTWSPTARASLVISVPFESAFAFLNKEDLSTTSLLRRWLPVQNRPGTRALPPEPPYFAKIEYDGRNKMWLRAETDPELQHRIQQSWLPWFTMFPAFGGEGLDALFKSIRADVDKIRSRGGKVVFIRMPSSGRLREIEREMWPRGAYWDRLLTETAAPGLHFEDHEPLRDFLCPEWSHLTRADAVTFTRHLAEIYRRQIGN